MGPRGGAPQQHRAPLGVLPLGLRLGRQLRRLHEGRSLLTQPDGLGLLQEDLATRAALDHQLDQDARPDLLLELPNRYRPVVFVDGSKPRPKMLHSKVSNM